MIYFNKNLVVIYTYIHFYILYKIIIHMVQKILIFKHIILNNKKKILKNRLYFALLANKKLKFEKVF